MKKNTFIVFVHHGDRTESEVDGPKFPGPGLSKSAGSPTRDFGARRGNITLGCHTRGADLQAAKITLKGDNIDSDHPQDKLANYV